MALASQYDRSWPLRLKRTVVDWPGCSVTFWNPLSWRGGSPAAAGSPRYSWATSDPATWPELVTVADTVTWLSDCPLHRQAVAPGSDVSFWTCCGVMLTPLKRKRVYDSP